MSIDRIDRIDLYSIQHVNPIVPVAKNKRQTPKAVVTKGKNPKRTGHICFSGGGWFFRIDEREAC